MTEADRAGAQGGESAPRADRDAAPAVPPVAACTPAPTTDPAAATVPVGPFRVTDADSRTLVRAVVGRAAATRGTRPCTAFALHVGGLNEREDVAFRAAMAEADVVYADGMSVVLLARLAGARHLDRAGTTDIGWGLLSETARVLGRPARVALLGGPPGLADRAGVVLAERAGVDVRSTDHGYHEQWAGVLAGLRAARPDVLVVGMGAPREMLWVQAHLAELPPCLVLTCGGWFGFLTGDEKRAPQWMQTAGLEWVFRVAQAPGRLTGRYATGVATTARLALPLLRERARVGRAPAGPTADPQPAIPGSPTGGKA